MAALRSCSALLVLCVLFPNPVASFLKPKGLSSFCLFQDDAPIDDAQHPFRTKWHLSVVAARERFGELVAPWALAVMVCVFASVITVCGFALQKKAVTGESESPKHFRVFSITLSPMWVAGFLLVTMATFPCDLLAYTLAPLSLTAPLSGLTVVMNQVVAPYLLTEKLQHWPDIPACALIVVGIVLTTSAGEHEEEKTITMGRLFHLARDYVFLGNLLILVLVIWGCIVRMEIRRHRHLLPAGASGSSVFDVALPAMVAAGAGGLTNILLKALGELLKNGDTWQQCVWCSLLILIPAVMQLNFVNMGLRLYAQTLFVPVYSALLVLTNTFYGAIFYQEYTNLLYDTQRGGCFCLGVVLIVSGLALFMQRRPEDGCALMDAAECQRAG